MCRALTSRLIALATYNSLVIESVITDGYMAILPVGAILFGLACVMAYLLYTRIDRANRAFGRLKDLCH